MKTLADFKVQRIGNTPVSVSDWGIFVHTFQIDSPFASSDSENLPGRHGSIGLGSTLRKRTMRAECTMVAQDHYDYELLRNEIFKLFRADKPFYIIRDAEPGKRWLINEMSLYAPTREQKRGKFTLEFISYSPFSHSIGTTQDPLTFESELWQFGQGLLLDDMIYNHTSTNFQIYNAGNETVNPRDMDLIIEYTGASNNLSIKNITTGDEWIYTGSSNAGDSIKLEGIQSTKNNLSILRNTNKKLISLDTGWNDFILTGTSGSFEIKFDFRFYYL
ncbi:phage tail family protein [Sutcliffiella horikoshii]|uniref:phage tail family protein n=1 Tax=Sutcliffiella horikoshii TaxID=79883 RepID=UPI003CF7BB71